MGGFQSKVKAEQALAEPPPKGEGGIFHRVMVRLQALQVTKSQATSRTAAAAVKAAAVARAGTGTVGRTWSAAGGGRGRRAALDKPAPLRHRACHRSREARALRGSWLVLDSARRGVLLGVPDECWARLKP